MDSKRDWDVKLTAYKTTFKVTPRATPIALIFGIEATLPIEFEVEALRVAVSSRVPVKQSLRNRLTDLEELDERRRVAAQHIEAFQRRRKKIFDKRNKKRALEPSMLVMIQNAQKMDILGKFDALWLGPYVVQTVFPNNSLQLEPLNGESFPWRTSRSRYKHVTNTTCMPSKGFMGSNPRWSPII